MSFLAGSFALTGCDPVQEEVDNNTVQSSAEDILSGITFTQYSDAEYTTPAADGNYIFYQTTPGRQVQIFNNRSDGTMNLLASGASGKFAIKPSRGSDSKQSFYIRALNSDGSVTTAETALNVFVQQELDPKSVSWPLMPMARRPGHGTPPSMTTVPYGATWVTVVARVLT